ncbi:minor histocompatibility antigen H13 isoform X2 [Bos indicus]|uniref:Minor histocompatibility antigen H13 isoform X2 n=1 Tax=Bos indicus TaxID=9915 RepID=A0A6P5CPZ4_BOSIN|nr:minor histocompatibility antigen H13 isoform X4 [Bos taurus]XP_027414690.1 minor histocompatibility antigen H13 isoform X7 [Bos indicus x Bos taurus]
MDSAVSDPHNGSAEAGGPTNGTTRPPSTPEGIALAYGSLLLMALLPIFFGALRSVRCARGKIFSQEYINLLLSMYFFVLGILALSHTISPLMNKFFPANFPNRQYQLLFTQGSGENKEEIINYEFDTKDLVCLGLSSIVGVWYLLRKHWIANNLFGLAFSLNGVELLHLNNVSTGCILLGGLFIYDIFWVFGTNVMVTVAKSFEAPIKLVFPQDLLEKGLEADNFAMLGLGDIVIPGIFIALLLRFDISLKKNTHTYFYTSFAAYIFGLGLTIFIMHIFKHAQPALLYLVPACIGFPVLVALAKGEVTEMFSYESSAEILPHTPRLTHFPTVSGSPASLADSMQQKLAGPRRRRPQNPSAIGRSRKLKMGLHKPNLSSICRCPATSWHHQAQRKWNQQPV